MAGVLFPAGARDFSILHIVQTGFGPIKPPIQEVNGLGVKLTTHLRLVPRSIMVELYFYSLTGFHGVMLN
jgi:hypothetical protein